MYVEKTGFSIVKLVKGPFRYFLLILERFGPKMGELYMISHLFFINYKNEKLGKKMKKMIKILQKSEKVE